MGNCFRLVCNLRKIPHSSRYQRLKVRKMAAASAGKLVLGQKALSITFIALLLVMGFSYLMLINDRATKGFEIKSLEKKIAELQKTQKQLQLDAADLQSIQNIQQRMNLENFVPVANISYLKNTGMALTVVK